MVRKLVPMLLLLFVPYMAFAGISEDMDAFVDRFNSGMNVTKGEVYKGQKAGHMTGGGITIRNQIIHSKPLSVTLPKIDAGCGGIDLYTGAFSYINSEELINTMKSIGSAAQGYAFLLALETVSPQIANNIKYLQEQANEINSLNINSCEIASQLTGAVWPRDTMASEHICRTFQSQKGRFADWVEGRHKCTSHSQKEFRKIDDQDDPYFSDLINGEFNIAWAALKKQGVFLKNEDRAELFMSLMGTIVKRQKEDGRFETQYFPSKIFDESFLHSVLLGGDTRVLECDEKKQCLFVKETDLSISEEKSWIGLVRELLFSIQDKILIDEELDPVEQDFIQRTRFPLYRIINVISAFSRGNNPVDIYKIADLVAMDMLLQYLREALDATRHGCEQLKLSQMFAHHCDDYLEHLKTVENKILVYELRTSEQLERELQLDRKIKIMEEELAEKINLSR